MPAKNSSFPVKKISQQSLASYNATPQTSVTDLKASISSALPPEIRKTRTGLELKPHKVNRIASPASKKKLTKADLEWGKPLQNELTMEAGSKEKTHSYRLLLGEGRVAPLPEIEERL